MLLLPLNPWKNGCVSVDVETQATLVQRNALLLRVLLGTLPVDKFQHSVFATLLSPWLCFCFIMAVYQML